MSRRPCFRWECILLAFAAILLVEPELTTTIIGTAIFVPIALRPLIWKRHAGDLAPTRII